MSSVICKRCGSPFERYRQKGRPATYCENCRAERRSSVQYNINQGVLEHRDVMRRAHGSGPHPCHWCGTALASSGPDKWVVDHLDDDGQNNDENNLVFSCGNCNRLRGRLSKWVRQMPVGRYLQLSKILEETWLSGFNSSKNVLMVSKLLNTMSEGEARQFLGEVGDDLDFDDIEEIIRVGDKFFVRNR